MKATRRVRFILGLAHVFLAGIVGCTGSENALIVPPGTQLVVSLSSTTRSDRAEPGDILLGRLARSVLVEGEVAIEAGRAVTLEIVESGSIEGDRRPRMALRVAAIELPSGTADVGTEPLEIVGRPERLSDAANVAMETVDGPVVGGIAQGGDDAVLDGAPGAPAGGVLAVSTRGDTMVLPAGQKLVFTTSDTIGIPPS